MNSKLFALYLRLRHLAAKLGARICDLLTGLQPPPPRRLDTLRARCPWLNRWLTELESLAEVEA